VFWPKIETDAIAPSWQRCVGANTLDASYGLHVMTGAVERRIVRFLQQPHETYSHAINLAVHLV